MSNKPTRVFKLINPETGIREGRYTAPTPYSAIQKAFSSFCRKKKSDFTKEVTLSIVETTKGSKKGKFTYKCCRIKLDNPVTYTIQTDSGEKEIIKEYKSMIHKVPNEKKVLETTKSKTEPVKENKIATRFTQVLTMDSNKKYYKVVNSEIVRSHNVFSGITPKEAVTKAFEYYLTHNKDNTNSGVVLALCQLGSENTYSFTCSKDEDEIVVEKIE